MRRPHSRVDVVVGAFVRLVVLSALIVPQQSCDWLAAEAALVFVEPRDFPWSSTPMTAGSGTTTVRVYSGAPSGTVVARVRAVDNDTSSQNDDDDDEDESPAFVTAAAGSRKKHWGKLLAIGSRGRQRLTVVGDSDDEHQQEDEDDEPVVVPSSNNKKRPDYSLYAGKDHSYFSVDSKTGLLVTAKTVDRPVGSWYDAIIVAYLDGKSEVLKLRVNVTQENRFPPRFSRTAYSVEISILARPNDTVVQCSAVDDDASETDGKVTYGILSSAFTVDSADDGSSSSSSWTSAAGNSNNLISGAGAITDDGLFRIDRLTGRISLARPLLSIVPQHAAKNNSPQSSTALSSSFSADFKVLATDGGSPQLSSVALVTVGVKKISAPEDVRVVGSTDSSAKICWTPPRTGPVPSYSIRFVEAQEPTTTTPAGGKSTSSSVSGEQATSKTSSSDERQKQRLAQEVRVSAKSMARATVGVPSASTVLGSSRDNERLSSPSSPPPPVFCATLTRLKPWTEYEFSVTGLIPAARRRSSAAATDKPLLRNEDVDEDDEFGLPSPTMTFDTKPDYCADSRCQHGQCVPLLLPAVIGAVALTAEGEDDNTTHHQFQRNNENDGRARRQGRRFQSSSSPSSSFFRASSEKRRQYECKCDPGYMGELCDRKDPCFESPCENFGACKIAGGDEPHHPSAMDAAIMGIEVHEPIDADGYYWCECLQGFYGRNCSLFDPCSSTSPCKNGATCVSERSHAYECRCPPGFFGRACEFLDPCFSSPCFNDARCRNVSEAAYECDCRPGFAGTLCERDVDECASSPCQNGGSCFDGVNGFSCRCPPGYAGDTCQFDVDECASSPCENGAACVDHVNAFECRCPRGYTGIRCERDIDECASNPCQNGATCEQGVDWYSCRCPHGYGGDLCEIRDRCSQDVTADTAWGILSWPATPHGETVYLPCPYGPAPTAAPASTAMTTGRLITRHRRSAVADEDTDNHLMQQGHDLSPAVNSSSAPRRRKTNTDRSAGEKKISEYGPDKARDQQSLIVNGSSAEAAENNEADLVLAYPTSKTKAGDADGDGGNEESFSTKHKLLVLGRPSYAFKGRNNGNKKRLQHLKHGSSSPNVDDDDDDHASVNWDRNSNDDDGEAEVIAQASRMCQLDPQRGAMWLEVIGTECRKTSLVKAQVDSQALVDATRTMGSLFLFMMNDVSSDEADGGTEKSAALFSETATKIHSLLEYALEDEKVAENMLMAVSNVLSALDTPTTGSAPAGADINKKSQSSHPPSSSESSAAPAGATNNTRMHQHRQISDSARLLASVVDEYAQRVPLESGDEMEARTENVILRVHRIPVSSSELQLASIRVDPAMAAEAGENKSANDTASAHNTMSDTDVTEENRQRAIPGSHAGAEAVLDDPSISSSTAADEDTGSLSFTADFFVRPDVPSASLFSAPQQEEELQQNGIRRWHHHPPSFGPDAEANGPSEPEALADNQQQEQLRNERKKMKAPEIVVPSEALRMAAATINAGDSSTASNEAAGSSVRLSFVAYRRGNLFHHMLMADDPGNQLTEDVSNGTVLGSSEGHGGRSDGARINRENRDGNNDGGGAAGNRRPTDTNQVQRGTLLAFHPRGTPVMSATFHEGTGSVGASSSAVLGLRVANLTRPVKILFPVPTIPAAITSGHSSSAGTLVGEQLQRWGVDERGHRAGSWRCAYWNEAESTWSFDGVETVIVGPSPQHGQMSPRDDGAPRSSSDGIGDQQQDTSQNGAGAVQCESSHLTSFSVLFDPTPTGGADGADLLASRIYGIRQHQAVLTFIGYLGTSLSLLGLAITILTYSLFRTLRQDIAGKILLNLCVSLFALDAVYLIGSLRADLADSAGEISVIIDGGGSNYSSNSSSSSSLCLIVAVALHYLVLTSLLWMLVEASHLYQLLVTVFMSTEAHVLFKRMLFAWGLPFCIVLTAVCVVGDMSMYEPATTSSLLAMDTAAEQQHQFCVASPHMNPYAYYLSYVGPAAVAALLNLVVFVRVCRVICYRTRVAGNKTVGITGTGPALGPPGSRVTLAQVWGVLSVMALLGVTWIFGPLLSLAVMPSSSAVTSRPEDAGSSSSSSATAADDGLAVLRLLFQYIFSISNGLQGFVIFLVRCLRYPEARHCWLHLLATGRIKRHRGPSSASVRHGVLTGAGRIPFFSSSRWMRSSNTNGDITSTSGNRTSNYYDSSAGGGGRKMAVSTTLSSSIGPLSVDADPAERHGRSARGNKTSSGSGVHPLGCFGGGKKTSVMIRAGQQQHQEEENHTYEVIRTDVSSESSNNGNSNMTDHNKEAGQHHRKGGNRDSETVKEGTVTSWQFLKPAEPLSGGRDDDLFVMPSAAEDDESSVTVYEDTSTLEQRQRSDNWTLQCRTSLNNISSCLNSGAISADIDLDHPAGGIRAQRRRRVTATLLDLPVMADAGVLINRAGHQYQQQQQDGIIGSNNKFNTCAGLPASCFSRRYSTETRRTSSGAGTLSSISRRLLDRTPSCASATTTRFNRGAGPLALSPWSSALTSAAPSAVDATIMAEWDDRATSTSHVQQPTGPSSLSCLPMRNNIVVVSEDDEAAGTKSLVMMSASSSRSRGAKKRGAILLNGQLVVTHQRPVALLTQDSIETAARDVDGDDDRDGGIDCDDEVHPNTDAAVTPASIVTIATNDDDCNRVIVTELQ